MHRDHGRLVIIGTFVLATVIGASPALTADFDADGFGDFGFAVAAFV